MPKSNARATPAQGMAEALADQRDSGSVRAWAVLSMHVGIKKETLLRGSPVDAAEQNRTVDTRIFSPLLYQLSYSGV